MPDIAIDPASRFGESPFDQDPSVEAVDLPIWRESLAVFDLIHLFQSPVYYGCGVPRGHGEPVVLVPGFLGDDSYLTLLWGWLRRMGYRSYFPGIGQLIDCPDYLRRLLTARAEEAMRETGQPVRFIGHSMGGMLARTVALDRPDLVERVISMGAPIRESVQTHPAMIEMTKIIRQAGLGPNLKASCFSGHCTCKFVENMYKVRQASVKRFAIYSKNDSVVSWEGCLEDDPDLNFEVRATHVGMAFDAQTYATIGKLLARD